HARRLVHLASDAMADVFAEDAVGLPRHLGDALRLDVLLNRGTEITEVTSGGHGCDARPHRAFGHSGEFLPPLDDVGARGIRNDYGDRAIAVPPLILGTAVNRNDVARLQNAIAGNAVH